jgi:hypothetical protein
MSFIIAAAAWLNANAGAILGIIVAVLLVLCVGVTVFSLIAKATASTKDDAWAAELTGLRAKILPWVNALALNPKATTGAEVLDRVAQVVEQKLTEHGQTQAAAITSTVAATIEGALAKAPVGTPSATLQKVAEVAEKVADGAQTVAAVIDPAAATDTGAPSPAPAAPAA